MESQAVYQTETTYNQATYPEITKLLLKSGVSPAHSGFKYICEAVVQIANDPTILHRVVKGLYANIGKKFNVTPASVERNIRHAIESAADTESFQKVIRGYCPEYSLKPTNSQFLALVNEILMNNFSV